LIRKHDLTQPQVGGKKKGTGASQRPSSKVPVDSEIISPKPKKKKEKGKNGPVSGYGTWEDEQGGLTSLQDEGGKWREMRKGKKKKDSND